MKKAFLHISSKTAVKDSFGCINYADLNCLYNELLNLVVKSTINENRIVLIGNNNRYLITLIMVLLDTKNEVILQEPKATMAETVKLIASYQANYLIDLNQCFKKGQFNLVFEEFNTTSLNISKAKLYYFSSGSTGQPKLFGYTIQNLIQLLQNWITTIKQEEKDIVLCPLTISHFHGTILSFSALKCKNTLLFLDKDALDIDQIETLLITFKPSIISGIPYFYQKLINQLKNRNILQGLKYAFCGSAPLTVQLAQHFNQHFKVHLNQAYGLSEIGVIGVDLNPQLGLGTVGKVLQKIVYKIINEDGNEVQKGEEGELIVCADYMTNGYLNLPEVTKKTFKNGWLYTSDIVKEDEFGRITILGRKSSFIIISGFKVYPTEIEQVILSFNPTINVAVKDQITNEEKTIIVAFIEANSTINLDALKVHCTKHLASYKLPSVYKFVNKLPKNSVGKIKYHQIEKL